MKQVNITGATRQCRAAWSSVLPSPARYAGIMWKIWSYWLRSRLRPPESFCCWIFGDGGECFNACRLDPGCNVMGRG